MHSIHLKIDDSVYDRVIGFLQILPADKVQISLDKDNSISFEEAKRKVERSIEHISKNEGMQLESAFEKVLNS